MKKTGRLLALALLLPSVTALSTPSAFACCCVVLQGDQYCVKCPSVRPEKLYMCPGGPTGLAVAALNHLNCSVTPYDQTSGDHGKHKKPPC
jgi:hypothetical protein